MSSLPDMRSVERPASQMCSENCIELKVRELFEYTQRSFGPFEYKPNMSSSGFNNAAPSEEQPDFYSFAPDSPNSFENTSFNDQPRGSKPLRLNQQNTTSENTSSNNPPKESVKRHESLLKNPNSFENSSFNDKPHQTETRSDHFAKPDYQGYRQKLETQRAPGRNQMCRVNGSYDNIGQQKCNSRTKLAGSRQRSRSLSRMSGAFLCEEDRDMPKVSEYHGGFGGSKHRPESETLQFHGYNQRSSSKHADVDQYRANGHEHMETEDVGLSQIASPNLMVNNLPTIMGQDEIEQMFSIMGTVRMCRLITDKTTGKSLGYGFVTYSNVEEATKAVASLNGYHIHKKTIKVSFACPNPQHTNLYVCGLPETLTEVEFRRLFEPFGRIASTRVLPPKLAGGLKTGLVRYATREEAEAAIDDMNGRNLFPEGGTLRVTFAHKNQPAASKDCQIGQAVPAMEENVNMRELSSDHFRKGALFGVNSSRNGRSFESSDKMKDGPGPIHRQHQGGRSRYSPLASHPKVYNNAPDSGRNSLGSSDGSMEDESYKREFVHKQVSFGAATIIPPDVKPRHDGLKASERPGVPVYALHVGNLDTSMEQLELKIWQLFGPMGAVHSVRVMMDPVTKVCKGYAFVNMLTCEGAVKAITTLNEHAMGNRNIQVTMKQQKIDMEHF
ncbi:RNA recognition motif domain-containing protein [Ditylenchus destructor]|uniref:RNA recognition motif domain-containing protein n=1 Tax=Ditylenchus destructor TaxID=166010 RepID=A0AAD4N181_9BILA|nr:RNA recognition motif domain-containing protein [Ditylenchus destructor]